MNKSVSNKFPYDLKKYYAFDLSKIFDFEESIEFLFVFELNAEEMAYDDVEYCVQLKDNVKGSEDNVEDWSCSIYKNIYYLFHKPGYDIIFEKMIPRMNEDGRLIINPRKDFENILQNQHVKYTFYPLVAELESKVLWKNGNGYMLHKHSWEDMDMQRWVLGFEQGFKRINGKYEVNKIDCFDALGISMEDFNVFVTDLLEESEMEKNKVLGFYTELLATLLLTENANTDANSFADFVYNLKRNFQEVKVFGAEESCFSAEPGSRELLPVFGGGARIVRKELKIHAIFQMKEENGEKRTRRYEFICEEAKDMKTYLVGYIRANTAEKQLGFVAKCRMLGKATEVSDWCSIDFEEWEDDEEE